MIAITFRRRARRLSFTPHSAPGTPPAPRGDAVAKAREPPPVMFRRVPKNIARRVTLPAAHFVALGFTPGYRRCIRDVARGGQQPFPNGG